MGSATAELKLSAEPREGGTLIHLSGVIDTNFPHDELLAMARGIVVIDLDGVSRLSSYGVRQWLKMVKDLKADYCCFVRARPAMIMQFNLMSNFAGNGELLSFYLPYVCEACGSYTERLIDARVEQVAIKACSPPATACASCGLPAEFDDIAETYLSFASHAAVPSPPPLVDALVPGPAKESPAPKS